MRGALCVGYRLACLRWELVFVLGRRVTWARCHGKARQGVPGRAGLPGWGHSGPGWGLLGPGLRVSVSLWAAVRHTWDSDPHRPCKPKANHERSGHVGMKPLSLPLKGHEPRNDPIGHHD